LGSGCATPAPPPPRRSLALAALVPAAARAAAPPSLAVLHECLAAATTVDAPGPELTDWLLVSPADSTSLGPLGELIELGLVSPVSPSGCVSIHRLVQVSTAV
jgi:hypothetical protein